MFSHSFKTKTMKTNTKTNQHHLQTLTLQLGSILMAAVTIASSAELGKKVEVIISSTGTAEHIISNDFFRKEKESVHEQFSYTSFARSPQISGS